MEKSINIPPFYEGQEIIAITNSHLWKKGDEFVAGSQFKCKCGIWHVDIMSGRYGTFCDCKSNSQGFFFSRCFAPKIESVYAVSITEVVQLETVCAN